MPDSPVVFDDNADLRGYAFFLVRDEKVILAGQNPAKAADHLVSRAGYLRELADHAGAALYLNNRALEVAREASPLDEDMPLAQVLVLNLVINNGSCQLPLYNGPHLPVSAVCVYRPAAPEFVPGGPTF